MTRLLCLWLLFPALLPAQSLERLVFDAGGDCVSLGLYTYAYAIGEPVSGTLQASLPYLTMGFQQPIPLSLLALPQPPLAAEPAGADVHLRWETPQGGYPLFWVEKAREGGDFEGLALLAGQPQAGAYAYTDSQAWQGAPAWLRYRLVYPDGAGALHYGPAVVVRPPAQGGLTLFPVPAQAQLHLRLPTPLSAPVHWAVYDLRGRHLRRGHWAQAAPVETLDLTGLPAGTYLLRLRTAQQQWQQRFVVAP